MFELPFHPKVVHLPIAFAMLMPLLSGGLFLAWIREWLPRRAWWIVVGVQALTVASGFGGLLSGERDEEVAERVVSEALIHAHEEAGQAFVAVTIAVFLCALFAGWVQREKLARSLAGLTIVGSLVALALGVRTGHMGGELVYRHGGGGAFTHGAPSAPATTEYDDD